MRSIAIIFLFTDFHPNFRYLQGDIYPVTEIGRVVTMVSSVFGIAIVALPAGIITAGYMDELNKISGEEDGSDDIKDENDTSDLK